MNSSEHIIQRIDNFTRKFGEGHLYFACHAALPLALTPDLAYRIWYNFQRDINGNSIKSKKGTSLNIPWIAVSDLLLSNFCKEVAHELYEMDQDIRNELLKMMRQDERFGKKRILELSNFLLKYIEDQLCSDDPYVRNIATSQKWVAMAYVEPDKVGRELAVILFEKVNQNDNTGVLRISSLINTVSAPLIDSGLEHIIIYSQHMEKLATDEYKEAKKWANRSILLKEVHLEQLDRLHKSDMLDKNAYEAARQKSLCIENSQVGIVGNHATVEGGIHYGNRFDIDAGRDVVFAKDKGVTIKIENIIPLNQPNEKIGNIAYDEKTGWSTLWNILSKGKAEYRQSLEEINRITYGDPLEIAKYYIEPDCQDVNPADQHSEQDFASKSPVLKMVNRFFQSPVFYRGDTQLFILSDAGMGKTALLTMLKLMDLVDLWPKQKACVLKKLGKETLYEIEKIERKSSTILLLDSLDEDPEAYGKVRERLLEILRASKNFFRTVITCRTQFFPRMEDDPLKRPGFFKIEEFTCHAKYLSLFSDEKVNQYLEKRFPKKFFFWKDNQKIMDAQTVISKMGSLRCRPMLLSYIENLMTSPLISRQSSEYHVYDALVQSWLAREKEKIPDIPEENLLKACIILAVIMQIRGWRSIKEKDMDQLIARMKDVLPVKQIDIKGRSLINRNSEGDYRFSHYSIQEFCVARLLLEKPVFTPKGNIPVTDFIFRQIAGSEKKPNFIEKLDFNALDFNTIGLKELKGLKLPGAVLREKKFSDVDLSNADLSNADLSNADFNNSDLSSSNFSNSNLSNSDFNNSDLSSSDFSNSNLSNSDFNNSDLSNSDLSNSDLRNTEFNYCNLTKTIFKNANLEGVDFDNI